MECAFLNSAQTHVHAHIPVRVYRGCMTCTGSLFCFFPVRFIFLRIRFALFNPAGFGFLPLRFAQSRSKFPMDDYFCLYCCSGDLLSVSSFFFPTARSAFIELNKNNRQKPPLDTLSLLLESNFSFQFIVKYLRLGHKFNSLIFYLFACQNLYVVFYLCFIYLPCASSKIINICGIVVKYLLRALLMFIRLRLIYKLCIQF